jgi:hypothetical protein
MSQTCRWNKKYRHNSKSVLVRVSEGNRGHIREGWELINGAPELATGAGNVEMPLPSWPKEREAFVVIPPIHQPSQEEYRMKDGQRIWEGRRKISSTELLFPILQWFRMSWDQDIVQWSMKISFPKQMMRLNRMARRTFIFLYKSKHFQTFLNYGRIH